MQRPAAVPPALVLLIAVFGLSVAAPLVRLSTAHAVAIAAWRLFFSHLVIGAILLATGRWRQWRALSRAELAIAAGAGVLLALHFWSWNTSLELTSVAASVVLVNLQPAFVAAGSALWLREPPGRAQLVGIGIAICGAAVVAAGDAMGGDGIGGGRNPLLGNLLALIGAITGAGYHVAGRRLRGTLDLWPYVGLVYTACFVALLAIAVIVRAPLLPQPPRELAIFVALAVGPMLVGHTGMNWALRYLPAYVVNLTVLGEMIGATLLAALLPGIDEQPSLATVVGGVLIIAGILLTARRRPGS